MTTDPIRLTVPPEAAGQRADSFLAENIPGLTRSQAGRLLREGAVTIAGEKAAPSHKVKPDDDICLIPPEPEPAEAGPEDLPLDIVYQDKDIAVINKQAGMVVHPAKGNHTGTLVNALLFHCKDLSGIGGKMRPGIVHRLDKDTSGIMAVAKNDAAHAALSAQLKDRTMGREYLAVVRGGFKEQNGTIDRPIGRHPQYRKKMSVVTDTPREAVTHWQVEEELGDCTLLRVSLATGRTHQIRVHLSAIQRPIVGDTVYGKKKSGIIDRPALHAHTLRLKHPATGETLTFTAEPPGDFLYLLERLRKAERLRKGRGK